METPCISSEGHKVGDSCSNDFELTKELDYYNK